MANLLSPEQQAALDEPSPVSYQERQVAIDCLDSRFFEIADRWLPRDVLSDFRATTGNSDEGSFMAAGLVIRSAAAYSDLIALGCIDPFSALPDIDWTVQTLVMTRVRSDSGCLLSSEVSVTQAKDGVARLNVSVRFNPDGSCQFDDARTFLVDQPMARAHLQVIAACDSSSATPDE